MSFFAQCFKCDNTQKQKALKKSKISIMYPIGLIVPCINFFLLQSYINYNIKTTQLEILNVLFFELFAWLLIFLINRISIGLLVQTIITFGFGILEYFVMQFRTTPILPWDIFSIGTAINVAENYKFTLNKNAVIVTICFVILIIGLIKISFSHKNEKIFAYAKKRIVSIITSLVCLVIFCLNVQKDSVMLWAGYDSRQFFPQYMMIENGIAVTLIYDAKYMFASEPDDYSVEDAEELLENYEDTSTTTTEDLPNVIAIMNETWSDLSVLGQDFETNEEVMPFISNLMEGAENTISGNCYVSIVGGDTANSEFEFMTGNTMRFMPSGSIPYMTYIKENTPSLASHMSELGYETYSLHPNTPNAWNRLKVYTNFGFDNILFDDLDGDDTLTTDIEKKRGYTTDQAVFDRIEQIYSEKDSDTPIFTWAVTIQDHGDYIAEDDFTPNIFAEGTDSLELSTYLSLMNLTDKAFENLVEYFSNYDEKTIIVMFGDHQPSNVVVKPIYELNGKSIYNLSTEETELRYITPYVIWANYDIEEATNVDTSANYLSAQLLQAGNIPCSDYQNYLLELSKEIPVLSNVSVIDSNGNNIADDSAYQDKINEYEKIAYYRLFDCKFADDD